MAAHETGPARSSGYCGGGGGNPRVDSLVSNTCFDQRVVLRQLNTQEPIPNQRYRITAEDGKVIEGRTDAEGKTERLPSDIAYGRYTIEPLDD